MPHYGETIYTNHNGNCFWNHASSSFCFSNDQTIISIFQYIPKFQVKTLRVTHRALQRQQYQKVVISVFISWYKYRNIKFKYIYLNYIFIPCHSDTPESEWQGINPNLASYSRYVALSFCLINCNIGVIGVVRRIRLNDAGKLLRIMLSTKWRTQQMLSPTFKGDSVYLFLIGMNKKLLLLNIIMILLQEYLWLQEETFSVCSLRLKMRKSFNRMLLEKMKNRILTVTKSVKTFLVGIVSTGEFQMSLSLKANGNTEMFRYCWKYQGFQKEKNVSICYKIILSLPCFFSFRWHWKYDKGSLKHLKIFIGVIRHL